MSEYERISELLTRLPYTITCGGSTWHSYTAPSAAEIERYARHGIIMMVTHNATE